MENAKKLFKAAVINADQLLESQARDIGDAKMTESKEDREQGRWKKTLNRIWKHNLAQEYYRQKEIDKARRDIIESDNLYKGETEFTDEAENTEHHKRAMSAIVERFTSEYETEMLKEEEINSKEKGNDQVNNQIKELIKQYAAGNMPEEAFKEEKKRILRGHNPDYAKEKSLYADNLLDIAREVRDAVKEGQKLDEMDFDIDLTFGKARESLNTESKKSTLDKFLGNSGVGKSIAQSAIMVGAVAGAYSVTKTLTVGLGRKAAKWLGFGAGVLAAGAISGVKENTRLNRERSQHIRESAKGMKFEEPDMERREEMERNRYETKGATEIITNLESDLLLAKAGNLSEADAQGILARLADLESRIRTGDQNKIDLISYDHFGNVEKDRMNLDLKRAELKVALRKGTKDKPLDLMAGEDFDTYLSNLTNAQSQDLLEGDISEKDRIFRSLKREKIAKKVVQSMLIGTAFSFGFDEMRSWFDSSKDGLIEGAYKSVKEYFGDGADHSSGLTHNATSLEAVRRWMFQDVPRMPTGDMHEIAIDNTQIHLPEGAELIQNQDGSYDVLRDDEIIANNIPIHFDGNGDLSQETKDLLSKEDIYTDFCQDTGGATESIRMSADEYVNEHPELTHRIHREVWFGNDTPMYPDPDRPGHLLGADLNELRTHWAGVGGTGIDSDGNYVLNVQHMTSDGSFQDGLSVDAHKLMENGELKMLLSLTKGTQFNVFEVPIDTNGNAIIDPDSPIGQMMFETDASGHAVFTGQFAEIAHSVGIAEDGGENVQILGTHIGTGRPGEVIDTIIKDVPHVTIGMPGDNDYEPPWPIPPATPRRPLERGKYDKAKPYSEGLVPIEYYMGGSGFVSSEEQRARYEKERSKVLQGNPDATLNQFNEINEYIEKQDKVYLERIEEIAREMGPMNKGCRLSVCIPVAGHQEGKNIYATLENYAAQTIKNDDFEIVLFVNRPDKDKDGNIINPDETMQEIERFKTDYPDMNIRVSEKVLPIKDARIGYIRKLMNDAVILRQQGRGKGSPELYMVSNDADNKGLSPKYIENFVKKFDNNKNVDSMIGQLDWDPGSYIRNPLIHIGTRLFQYTSAQSRAHGWHFDSSGANFAFRSSIYAGVGGYSGDMSGGEDTDFGAKISEARKGSKDKKAIVYAGARDSRLYTSSRRAEMVMEHGLSPVEQWDKGFSAFDDEVRKIDWESKGERVDYKNKEEVKKLVRSLEAVINRTIKKGVDNKWFTVEDRTIQRSLGWLGIKYVVASDNSIKITDAKKLIKGLEQYQKDGLDILKNKISKKEKIEKEIVSSKNQKTKKTKEVPKTTSTPEAKPEKPERIETISKEEFEKEIKNTFTEILKNGGDNATIEKFKLDIVDGSITGHAELKARNSAGGTPLIDLDIVSGPSGLVFNKTGNKIKANMLARGAVNEAVAGVPKKIKESLEKRYGESIKKIEIANGQLKLTF